MFVDRNPGLAMHRDAYLRSCAESMVLLDDATVGLTASVAAAARGIACWHGAASGPCRAPGWLMVAVGNKHQVLAFDADLIEKHSASFA